MHAVDAIVGKGRPALTTPAGDTVSETQTISQRARATPPAEMPEGERPITEQFRIIARKWATADAAAYLMHESKASVLSQMTLAIYEVPFGEKRPSQGMAELKARASSEWHEYLNKMADARREANLLRVQLDYIRMVERKQDRDNWNNRSEHKLGRSTP